MLVEISETASRVNSQLVTRARMRREESGALSIQQKFRFEISETSRTFQVLHGTVHSDCTDPTQATTRFVIVPSQQTQNYTLKEKSKYCLYPKEHSTVEKGRWKAKGGGILFRVDSL